jgi:hypothetical protein
MNSLKLTVIGASAIAVRPRAPAWASHLCKNVKGDLIQEQNFIANNEELIFQQ